MTLRDSARYTGGGMEERWNELAAAIIEQAVTDYKRGGAEVREECTVFFLSDWLKVVSGGVSGRIVLERLRGNDAD